VSSSVVYREVAPGSEPGAARPVKGAFERLEPDEVKVSSPVLRGGRRQRRLATRPADLAVEPVCKTVIVVEL
jgi:hypothetical protein